MVFRNDFDAYDLEGACVHARLEVDSVMHKYTQLANPLELLQTMGFNLTPLQKYSSGWAVGKTVEEILNILPEINQTIKSYWEELLQIEVYSPVIVIDSELCDGAHRCILAYLLAQEVKAAYFNSF